MPLSLHQASVAVFEQILGALSGVLDKGEAYAAARKVDQAILLRARLFPNMAPFVWQVQMACDLAKTCAAKLGGAPVTPLADDQKTFADLKQRIADTLAAIRAVDHAAIEAAADATIDFKVGPMQARMKGADYLLHFVLPNVMFHATTAYDILRENGVEIGKPDFLGRVPGLTIMETAPA